MTYCLGLHRREGLAFLSDSHTSAGGDNITTHPEMRAYERVGDRGLCMPSSGSLSVTQLGSALIDRDFEKTCIQYGSAGKAD